MMSEERRKAIAKLMFGKNADIVMNFLPMLFGMWGVPPPGPPLGPPPESQEGESKDEPKE